MKNSLYPQKTIFPNNKKTFLPWYSQQISAARREQRRLERVWKKTKNPDDWSCFSSSRHEFITLLKSSKEAFIRKELGNADSSGSRWSALNKIVGKMPNTLRPL